MPAWATPSEPAVPSVGSGCVSRRGGFVLTITTVFRFVLGIERTGMVAAPAGLVRSTVGLAVAFLFPFPERRVLARVAVGDGASTGDGTEVVGGVRVAVGESACFRADVFDAMMRALSAVRPGECAEGGDDMVDGVWYWIHELVLPRELVLAVSTWWLKAK